VLTKFMILQLQEGECVWSTSIQPTALHVMQCVIWRWPL